MNGKGDTPRWFMWPLLLAIPVIAAVAFAVIAAFRGNADTTRRVETALARLEGKVALLDGLTWRAVVEHPVRPEVLDEIRAARARLTDLLGPDPARRNGAGPTPGTLSELDRLPGGRPELESIRQLC